MTADIIEGEAVEVEPRAIAIVTQQPGQTLVTDGAFEGPDVMLQRATHIATALADVVERQRLYTVISGKKYPQVEAWMTIGRMDNVVAREASKPARNDDESWEAEVELIRLSDGMVVGNASAMCGAKGDRPWDSRPAHQRRSMAVTRATSRAFRQQYSWIMALAGYEPTPADEMPDEQRETHQPEQTTHADGLVGTVAKGNAPVDLEQRQSPDGPIWGFKLMDGRKGYQALATGTLAEVLASVGVEVGTRVTVWGPIEMVPWEKNGEKMPPYARIHIERVQTPEWTLPAPDSATERPEPVEAESVPMLPLDDEERALIAGGLK
jgi:hypothetical protein